VVEWEWGEEDEGDVVEEGKGAGKTL